MKTSGIFLVIDGTDGSGKATQAKLLLQRLEAEGHRVKTISFPQYGTKSAGLVEEYLEGKYGAAHEVGPYRASALYAADRFHASFEIRSWLSEGYVVIADRYVGSNMGHQGGKITDPAERKRFFDWAQEFEHEFFGIPRPTKNIVLYVPVDISQALARKRNETAGNDHTLSQDIHEADDNHMHAASHAYLELTKLYEEFHLIDCTHDNQLRSREEIHDLIWNITSPLLSR